MKKFDEFYSIINEVTDRANVSVQWNSDYTQARFRAGDLTYVVSIESSTPGFCTIMFSQNGSYSKKGDVGATSAAVFSGVLTILREYTENFEQEYGMKPYSFDFTAAAEFAPQSEYYNKSYDFFNNLPLEELKQAFKEYISRPVLYYALSLQFGGKNGFDVEISSSAIKKLSKGASDFRSVRRNLNDSISKLSHDELLRVMRSVVVATFVLTNKSTSPSDYEEFDDNKTVENINSIVNYDEYWQDIVARWIDEGREDEILEYAYDDVLISIAHAGMMHDVLIFNDDEDVRLAVIDNNPDMAFKLVDSESWEHRQQAASLGLGTDVLMFDSDEDVREAAWEYLGDNVSANEIISMLNRASESQLETAKGHLVDSDDYEIRAYAASKGHAVDVLINDYDSDVREAAMDYYIERGEYERMLSNADDEEECIEYAINQYDNVADEILDAARELGIGVSRWEDE